MIEVLYEIKKDESTKNEINNKDELIQDQIELSFESYDLLWLFQRNRSLFDSRLQEFVSSHKGKRLKLRLRLE